MRIGANVGGEVKIECEVETGSEIKRGREVS